MKYYVPFPPSTFHRLSMFIFDIVVGSARLLCVDCLQDNTGERVGKTSEKVIDDLLGDSEQAINDYVENGGKGAQRDSEGSGR